MVRKIKPQHIEEIKKEEKKRKGNREQGRKSKFLQYKISFGNTGKLISRNNSISCIATVFWSKYEFIHTFRKHIYYKFRICLDKIFY